MTSARFMAAAGFMIVILIQGVLQAGPAEDIRALTGTHTRVVWIESSGDSRDRYGHNPYSKLMGIDTDDGKGIVEIDPVRASYSKPMILPHGERIVFTNSVTGNVEVINWDGTGQRVVIAGICCDVWLDSETDVEYIIVGDDAPGHLTRYAVDDISDATLIWNNTEVGSATFGAITFQLSGDGKHGWGGFPWPATAFVNLPNGHKEVLDEGCWPAMSPELSYLTFVFNTDHRTASMYDATYTQLCELDVHNAPGIKGWEVCHIKWGNTDDIISMTGPYDGGDGGYCESDNCGNMMSAGGANMNLYIGKLAEDNLSVARWVRITDNDQADFYGDVWVNPGTRTRYKPIITSQPATRSVFENGDVDLQVRVDAWPYPDYQWYKDGVPVDGAEFSVLKLEKMDVGDAGTYTVHVSSSAGTTISADVVITVESVASDNLVLHYSFEGGLCKDLAGSNDGEIHGAVPSTDAAVGSGSFSFDGGDRINAGLGGVLDNLNPCTYAMWIKPSVLGGALVGKEQARDFWHGRELSLGADGSVSFQLSRSGNNDFARTAAGAVTADTWQHLAVTRSEAGTVHVYVNGIETAYDSTMIGGGRYISDYEGDLSIGAYRSYGGSYYTGLIDDVRLFNYPLTGSEVTALYGMTGIKEPAVQRVSDAMRIPGTVTAAELITIIRASDGRFSLYSGTGQVLNRAVNTGMYFFRTIEDGKVYRGRIMVIR